MVLSLLRRYASYYVAFFRTGIVYHSNSRYRVPGIRHFSRVRTVCTRARARAPSPSPPRSNLGPEPEPSSLDSDMDDTLSPPEPPCEPKYPSVSLGCRAFTGTAEVYQVGISIVVIRARIVLLYQVCKMLERIIPGTRYSLTCKPASRPTISLSDNVLDILCTVVLIGVAMMKLFKPRTSKSTFFVL